MAMESSQVTADVVEVTEFRELASKYSIRGVPKTVINDTVEFVGAEPEGRFVDFLRQAVSQN